MPRVSRSIFGGIQLVAFHQTSNRCIKGTCCSISGRQKYEMFTIQFPLCGSSSTLDNRILLPSCNYDADQVQRQSRIQYPACKSMAAHPRTSILNVVYSKDEARERVMETLAWSINALSVLVSFINLYFQSCMLENVKCGYPCF